MNLVCVFTMFGAVAYGHGPTAMLSQVLEKEQKSIETNSKQRVCFLLSVCFLG